MQNGQNSNFLTVLPPSPFSQLGKYQRKGVFVVRKGDEILYIGQASNICRAAKRLFYQKGALQHIDQRTVLFEVITSKARSSIVLESLKGELAPQYNHSKKHPPKLNAYQKNQQKRVLNAYYEQTRFAVMGEHRSDSE